MMVESAKQGDNNEFSQPFFYGSHYSTALGTVLYFLLRKEPFTQLHVCLQDGHFDHPDRLFYDIPVAIRSCLESMPEVKEVTPEWYTDQSFLVNVNKQKFGKKQDHTEVDAVILPSLHGVPLSPAAFIAANHQALESYVTTTFLHAWIDLVFGAKQTGEQAVQAYNVFYPLTYFSNIDLTEVDDDPHARKAVITQASHFGQCPQQVFLEPHPSNRPDRTICRSLRETLLACRGRALTAVPARRWLGRTCRLQRVSDMDLAPTVSPSGLHRFQGIMGADGLDCKQGRPLAEYQEQECVLNWPVPTSYPWTVTVDCNELTELAMIKVVLAPTAQTMDYNIQHHCFAVEIFTEEGVWEPATILAEISAKTESGIQSLLTLKPTTTRYWRLKILEIPFSLSAAGGTAVVAREKVGGEREVQTEGLVTYLPSPSVKVIDVLGTTHFPRELPRGWITTSPIAANVSPVLAVW